MADQPGGGSGIHKEFLGQPAWLWAVGAVVIVGGYLYIKHQSSSASTSGSGTSGQGGQDKSSSNLKETITDWQSPPSNPKPGKKPHQGGGAGPERKWLIHKTGSQHPWSFLARHHERIEVGPTGSRKIVKDK